MNKAAEIKEQHCVFILYCDTKRDRLKGNSADAKTSVIFK